MDFMKAIKAMKKGKKLVTCGVFVVWLEGVHFMNDKLIEDKLEGKPTECMTLPYVEATDWKLFKEEELIKGANIEPSSDMHFYCLKCDTAPIDVEKDKDGFYICKECKGYASVVDKDEQEKA